MPAGFVTVPVTVVCVPARGVAGFGVAAIVTTAGCKMKLSFSVSKEKRHSAHKLHVDCVESGRAFTQPGSLRRTFWAFGPGLVKNILAQVKASATEQQNFRPPPVLPLSQNSICFHLKLQLRARQVPTCNTQCFCQAEKGMGLTTHHKEGGPSG